MGKSGRAISLISAMDLMNFNRLVKRYHVAVKEIAVPTDEEVQERKASRIVEALGEAGKRLPLEDFLDLGPAARAIAAHELRDRIVALLLRGHLQSLVAKAPDEDVEPAFTPEGAGAEAPQRRSYGHGHGPGGGGGGGGRRRRRRR